MFPDEVVMVALCLGDLGQQVDIELRVIGVCPAAVTETESGAFGDPVAGLSEDAFGGQAERADGLDVPAVIE
ncbi:hypothetical protein [Streptomyces sp. ISL-36]|uniref:hypothetical protein n=1 Tax=Streptomyces sp. ISL-36 TaxID=2819182 RepID=UPI002035E0ED|nr:hypothetical protein [Streptomyces sp. ISL-36]